MSDYQIIDYSSAESIASLRDQVSFESNLKEAKKYGKLTPRVSRIADIRAKAQYEFMKHTIGSYEFNRNERIARAQLAEFNPDNF